MLKELMPSQKNIYKKIIKDEDYLRRGNKLLLGKPQIGKTVLAKYLKKEDKKYYYVDFVEECLEEFVKGKGLNNLIFNDLINFLRDNFDREDKKDKTIILDEMDPVFTLFTGGKSHGIITLYKQCLEMDFQKEFMFISSIYNEKIGEDLSREYRERVFILEFNNNDKKHIIKYHLDNINLFDLDNITNIRQFKNV